MKLTLEEAQKWMDENYGNLDLGYIPITTLPEGLKLGGKLLWLGKEITAPPENEMAGEITFAKRIGMVQVIKILEKLIERGNGRL